MFLLSLLLAAQSADKLPPANPLPYEDPDIAAVMAPVDALLAGIAARDAAAMRAQLRPEGGAIVAKEAADGTRTLTWLSWTQVLEGVKPGPERFQEKLLNPAVEIDGDIAMVWSNYTFTIDGRMHHCGVDHFDLVRENGAWKIANISWSSRTTGC